ncbi:Uncharacterized phage protein gp47/JayE [Oscillibacter sp. PC13]|uniref:baseplate J/gp47 family protein n=1 Tax=Oscillibacter sp. PC13 TaxID=1855299 RepID=UPI0008E4B86A|nr:baseplate J/gp47 family protein [Oscillibacter sp. PC13]SFP19534.1 Uncharacterized phage protein gp47/JayE [Oscillibacter sp. PC13]
MRTIEEIYEELLNAFAQRAGFTPDDSCDLTVRLYALAAQLQALSIQADWVLDQSFPQTAQGIYLDRHAAMRGIKRTAASKSAGMLRFYVDTAASAPLTIPDGTVCMTAAEVRFQTTAVGNIPAGELFADVPAESLGTGNGTNVAAGAIHILTACPVAVTSCTNPEAFQGGSDEESDEALRQRILESYQRLPNGANAAYYEQTAMQHDGVAAAKAVGRARGIGTVNVYVTTEAGLPSESLLAEIQENLQEKREIAVDVQVLAPEVTEIDLTVEVAAREGIAFAEAKAAVEQAAAELFSGKLLGKAIRLAEIGNQIYGVDGIENYRILAPTEDLAANEAVLPVLGTLTVTQMEA